MTTLNQIVDRIEKIADNHYQVKTFDSGTISQFLERNQAGDLIYPCVYLEERPASSTGGAMFFNFNVWVVDLVQKDRSNEREVKSDCLSIATDFVTIMERFEFIGESGDALFYPSQTVNYEFVTEDLQDRISGVRANVSLKQGFEFNKCITPITNNNNNC